MTFQPQRMTDDLRQPRTTNDARLSEVTWDGYTAAALARHCGVPRVELFAETESTLDVAHAVADQGAPAGTLVVADAQTAGRGRFGRTWSSPVGRGVWMTVVERPRDARVLEVLSLRVGLRCAEALDDFAGGQVGTKWPNDLMLGAGKLGGILCEARWSGESLAWIGVGVGVNVEAPRDVDAAGGLRPDVPRIDVLRALVHAVRAAAGCSGALTPDELARFADRDVLRGRRIASPAVGTVLSIDPSGALLVSTANGHELHRAGTIRFAEERNGEGDS